MRSIIVIGLLLFRFPRLFGYALIGRKVMDVRSRMFGHELDDRTADSERRMDFIMDDLGRDIVAREFQVSMRDRSVDVDHVDFRLVGKFGAIEVLRPKTLPVVLGCRRSGCSLFRRLYVCYGRTLHLLRILDTCSHCRSKIRSSMGIKKGRSLSCFANRSRLHEVEVLRDYAQMNLSNLLICLW